MRAISSRIFVSRCVVDCLLEIISILPIKFPIPIKGEGSGYVDGATIGLQPHPHYYLGYVKNLGGHDNL